MNDLLSIAKRLRGYADKPGTDRQEQQDLLVAADFLALNSALPDARALMIDRKDSPIPG